MHAIRIGEHGDPGVLLWAEVPQPVPASDELLVRVEAAGVNYIDTYHRTGLYPTELPLTPGLEGAGVVEAVGAGVDPGVVGARVAWTNAMGSYAEYVTVAAGQAVAIPDGLPSATAAAAMLQGMTAHYLSHDTFPISEGHRCLIHAGAGGVGLLLIQMAKTRGAEVFTTVSTKEKAALAAGAGADHVIRYETADFGGRVEEIAGPRPLHVIYDGVGRATFARGLELLRPCGMMVLFGQSSGVVEPFDLGALARNGSLYVTRPTLFDYVGSREALQARSAAVLGAATDGTLDVRIGHRWPMSEAAEAHRALEARRTTGKLLLVPS